jgi:hypothetical protein
MGRRIPGPKACDSQWQDGKARVKELATNLELCDLFLHTKKKNYLKKKKSVS